jgi:DNA-binding XRE family transcriptional regulator
MLVLELERRRKDMTQQGLSQASGVGRTTITAFENTRMVPYQTQIDRIARVLGWEGDPYALLEEVPK